jgi:hypothetical protein
MIHISNRFVTPKAQQPISCPLPHAPCQHCCWDGDETKLAGVGGLVLVAVAVFPQQSPLLQPALERVVSLEQCAECLGGIFVNPKLLRMAKVCHELNEP